MAGFNLTAKLNITGPYNIKSVVQSVQSQLSNIKANVNINVNQAASNNIKGLTGSVNALNSALQAANGNAASLNTNLRNLSTAFNSSKSIIQQTATAISQIQKNTAQTSKALNIGTSDMQKFGREAALAVKRAGAFAVATAGIFGLTRAISGGISKAIEFEKGITKLVQVTKISRDGLKGLTDEIDRLSVSLGTSSEEMLEVAKIFTQAGLSIQDTKIAMEAVAKSTLAPSFDSIINTTEGLIAVVGQFRDEMTGAGIGAKDFEKVLGSINRVSADFAVEADDIVSAIRKTGGVFAAASRGIGTPVEQLNELIAVFTSVRATTRESADSIATGLRTIFTRIQRPETIEMLRDLGVELLDVEGKFVGPYQAMQKLGEAFNKIDTRSQIFASVTEELGGIRQIGKLIPAIKQYEEQQRALAVAQKGQTSLAEDADIAQQSLANQISKTREEFLKLTRDLFNTSSFQAIAKTTLEVARGFIQIADSVKELIPLITIVAGVRGLGAFNEFSKGFVGSFRGPVRRNTGGIIPGFNAGGEVKRFNTGGLVSGVKPKDDTFPGGLVPGVGDTDSYLTKLKGGEFVLRKPAVKAIGVERLARMNSGGIVDKNIGGGVVRHGKMAYGSKEELEEQRRSILRNKYPSYNEQQIKNRTEYVTSLFNKKRNSITNKDDLDDLNLFQRKKTEDTQIRQKNREDSQKKPDEPSNPKYHIAVTEPIGGSFFNPSPSNDTVIDSTIGLSSGVLSQPTKEKLLNIIQKSPVAKKSDGSQDSISIDDLGTGYATNARGFYIGQDTYQLINQNIKHNLVDAIHNTAQAFAVQSNLGNIPNISNKEQFFESIGGNGLMGNLFEGFVGAVTDSGEFMARAGQQRGFDFRIGTDNAQNAIGAKNPKGFDALFGAGTSSVSFLDAKVNNNSDNKQDIVRKGLNAIADGVITNYQVSKGALKFASGGLVPKLSSIAGARVFDFDNTIAKTQAKTFADFSNTDLIDNAQNTPYTKTAEKLGKSGQDIYVLTARLVNEKIKNSIQNYLAKNNIAAKGIIGVADMFKEETTEGKRGPRKLNVAEKKAKVLQDLRKQYGKVIFYDDEADNIEAAKNVGVKSVLAKKYAQGGNVDSQLTLLTPGEFVVSEPAAREIGYDRLHELNNADRIKVPGMNKGGIVGDIGGGIVRHGKMAYGNKLLDNEGIRNSLTSSIGAIPINIGPKSKVLDSKISALIKSAQNMGLSLEESAKIGKIFGNELTKSKSVLSSFQTASKEMDQIAKIKLAQKLSEAKIDPAQFAKLSNTFEKMIKNGKSVEESFIRVNKTLESVIKYNSSKPNWFSRISSKVGTSVSDSFMQLRGFGANYSKQSKDKRIEIKNKRNADLNRIQNIGFGAIGIAATANAFLPEAKSAGQAAGQAGLTGAAGGAGIGIELGSLLGPKGALIGGAIGGLYGAINSATNAFYDFQIETNSKKLDSAMTKLSESIEKINYDINSDNYFNAIRNTSNVLKTVNERSQINRNKEDNSLYNTFINSRQIGASVFNPVMAPVNMALEGIDLGFGTNYASNLDFLSIAGTSRLIKSDISGKNINTIKNEEDTGKYLDNFNKSEKDTFTQLRSPTIQRLRELEARGTGFDKLSKIDQKDIKEILAKSNPDFQRLVESGASTGLSPERLQKIIDTLSAIELEKAKKYGEEIAKINEVTNSLQKNKIHLDLLEEGLSKASSSLDIFTSKSNESFAGIDSLISRASGSNSFNAVSQNNPFQDIRLSTQNEIESAIDKLGTQFGLKGEAGFDRASKIAVEGKSFLDKLPGLIENNLLSSGTVEQDKLSEIKSRILKESGISDETVRKDISLKLDQILSSPEGTVIDPQAINEKLGNLSQDIAPILNKVFSDVFSKMQSNLDSILKQRFERDFAIRSAQQDIQFQTSDIQTSSELRQFSNEEQDTGRFQFDVRKYIQDKSVLDLTSGGVSGLSGTTDGAEIKSRIDSLNAQIRLAEQNGELTEETNELRLELNRNKKALDIVSKNAIKLAAAEDKLANIQAKNQAANGIARGFLGADFEGKVRMAQGFKLAAMYASGTEKERQSGFNALLTNPEGFNQMASAIDAIRGMGLAGKKAAEKLDADLAKRFFGEKALADMGIGEKAEAQAKAELEAEKRIAEDNQIRTIQTGNLPLEYAIMENSLWVSKLTDAYREAQNQIPFGDRFASGGLVTGPGTGTSDSIPTKLSNGEYVLRAAAVQKLGVGNLNRLNRFAKGGKFDINNPFDLSEEQLAEVRKEKFDELDAQKKARAARAKELTDARNAKFQAEKTRSNQVRGEQILKREGILNQEGVFVPEQDNSNHLDKLRKDFGIESNLEESKKTQDRITELNKPGSSKLTPAQKEELEKRMSQYQGELYRKTKTESIIEEERRNKDFEGYKSGSINIAKNAIKHLNTTESPEEADRLNRNRLETLDGSELRYNAQDYREGEIVKNRILGNQKLEASDEIFRSKSRKIRLENSLSRDRDPYMIFADSIARTFSGRDKPEGSMRKYANASLSSINTDKSGNIKFYPKKGFEALENISSVVGGVLNYGADLGRKYDFYNPFISTLQKKPEDLSVSAGKFGKKISVGGYKNLDTNRKEDLFNDISINDNSFIVKGAGYINSFLNYFTKNDKKYNKKMSPEAEKIFRARLIQHGAFGMEDDISQIDSQKNNRTRFFKNLIPNPAHLDDDPIGLDYYEELAKKGDVGRGISIKEAERERLDFLKRNKLLKADGGSIIGQGSSTSDSINALVSNGEYIMSAKSAGRIGIHALDHMNKFGTLPKFSDGGVAGSIMNSISSAMPKIDISKLASVFTGFNAGITEFTKSIDSLKQTQIQGVFTHTVNVNISGGEALKGLILQIISDNMKNKTTPDVAKLFDSQQRIENNIA